VIHHQLSESVFHNLVNRPVVLLAIERAGNWKKVREQVLEYGWMQLEETTICIRRRAAVGTTILGGASLEELYPFACTQSFSRQLDDQGNEKVREIQSFTWRRKLCMNYCTN
jgi:hypothetical protein